MMMHASAEALMRARQCIAHTVLTDVNTCCRQDCRNAVFVGRRSRGCRVRRGRGQPGSDGARAAARAQATQAVVHEAGDAECVLDPHVVRRCHPHVCFVPARPVGVICFPSLSSQRSQFRPDPGQPFDRPPFIPSTAVLCVPFALKGSTFET